TVFPWDEIVPARVPDAMCPNLSRACPPSRRPSAPTVRGLSRNGGYVHRRWNFSQPSVNAASYRAYGEKLSVRAPALAPNHETTSLRPASERSLEISKPSLIL